MIYCPISSGSKGNCHFVSSQNTKILVDAGITAKSIVTLLSTLDIDPAALSGILITHEHIDHIAGVDVLARKYNIPIYANFKTGQELLSKFPRLNEGNLRYFKTGESFYINDLDITPFPIPHDSQEPVGYTIFSGIKKLTLVTDVGHINNKMLEYMKDSHLILIEANHDIDMLIKGRYPQSLKKRILGKKGHLSNLSCGETLAKLVNSRLYQVVLGHLSEENNTAAIAYETVQAQLALAGVRAKELPVDIAYQNKRGACYKINLQF